MDDTNQNQNKLKPTDYTSGQIAEAHLMAIFETAIDAIIMIDERGIIKTANPATEKLFGYLREELVGKNVSTLMPSPDKERHDSYLSNYLHGGQAKIIGIGREVNGVRKTGEPIPLRLAVSETVIGNNRFFTGILHDLTAVKAAEAKIRKLNEELEQKVRERTEELAAVINKLLETNSQLLNENSERKAVEEALRQSERELLRSLEKEKELSELKSRFVTMASHEFRTPLSAILSSTDLIELYTKKENEADKRLKHVNRIKSAVNNLTNILEDFLSLSKLEEARVNVEFGWVNLKEFCEDVTDELRGLLKPNQEIIHTLSGTDGLVLTDKKILKNILINLLSNAIKYSSDLINCDLDISKNTIRVQVTDRGIGISEQDQQHLFTRFFRGKNAENIQGTGLGLHIVRRYLDLLDGEIEFTSKPGAGTTFTFKIPIPDAQ